MDRHAAPIASKAPPKTTEPAALHAFGIDVPIEAAHGQSAGRKPLDRTKKAWIAFACLITVSAGVWWWQNRPAPDSDPDLADHPEIAQVQKLKSKNDTTALAPLVKDRDVVVASRAVQALGDLGDSRAVASAMSDSRSEVRFAAASAIGASAGPEHIPALSKVMREDTNRDVRLAAMRSLSSVHDFSIFDHLIAALQDSDPNIRRSALGAIEKRIGLVFPDFKPNGSSESRAQAIAHIRQLLPAYKKGFEEDAARARAAKGASR